jgi:hypothetical protein
VIDSAGHGRAAGNKIKQSPVLLPMVSTNLQEIFKIVQVVCSFDPAIAVCGSKGIYQPETPNSTSCALVYFHNPDINVHVSNTIPDAIATSISYRRIAAPRTPIAIIPLIPVVITGARPELVALAAAAL